MRDLVDYLAQDPEERIDPPDDFLEEEDILHHYFQEDDALEGEEFWLDDED